MKFYEVLNNYYDEIFPFSNDTYQFIKDTAQDGKNILETGSATGKYINALKNEGYKAVGLEHEKIFMNYSYSLIIGDMHFYPLKRESFETVFCIGNTLAHAKNSTEVHKILYNSFSLLKPGGTLIIQTVNYDRIFANNLKELPAIETKNLIFERYYEYNDDKKIYFNGVLTDKQINKTYSAVVELTPVFFDDYIKASGQIGASFVNFNGDFRYGKLQKYESFMTVASFTKPGKLQQIDSPSR